MVRKYKKQVRRPKRNTETDIVDVSASGTNAHPSNRTDDSLTEMVCITSTLHQVLSFYTFIFCLYRLTSLNLLCLQKNRSPKLKKIG